MKTTTEQQLDQLAEAAHLSSRLIALGIRGERDVPRGLIRFRFTVPGGAALAHLRLTSEGRVVLTMSGREKASRQTLRRVLLGVAQLLPRGGETHRIVEFAADTTPNAIIRSLASWIQTVCVEAEVRADIASGRRAASQDEVFSFWADVRSNFGDQIGPWLIQKFTGRRAVNARYSTIDHGQMLATVGSIIHMLPTSATTSVDIWGSGLMRRPSPEELLGLEKLEDVRVHAVRGRLTREILQDELGWTVPEVFGDPALLCPQYYTPEPATVRGGIVFVPHFKHIEHHVDTAVQFQKEIGDSAHVVDVHADLRDVINQIASATVCISSSLHGIIIAQAYGVPWVWLYAPDKNIGGARFKFDDFFSTLKNPDDVAVHEAKIRDFLKLPFSEIAAHAALPELDIDLDALRQAFPVTEAATKRTPVRPKFRWNRFSAEDRFMAEVRSAYRSSH